MKHTEEEVIEYTSMVESRDARIAELEAENERLLEEVRRIEGQWVDALRSSLTTTIYPEDNVKPGTIQ